MTRLPHLLLVALSLTGFGTLTRAQEGGGKPDDKPIVKSIELKDGDTLVFLGDSITHQCLYTQYVEDYFYTRYPKQRIRFHNAGVGGDRAIDALNRFDEDVAAFKPKYVTVLLGMNDGTYTKFEQGVFDVYERDMTKLLDRIAEIGATAVPMTPTMHDSRARRLYGKPSEPRDTYYNGVLAFYGAWLREQAHVRGLGFVDMYSPLNNLTTEKRKTDPKWTMIRDAVHPGPTGQVVMAAALINDMVQVRPVSVVNLRKAGDWKVARTTTANVSDVESAEGGVRFTVEANALPWVLPDDAQEGVKLVKLAQRFSNERLSVQGLDAGKYWVKVDGMEVGQWTAEQLARGINLGGNEKTPQYQQAKKVATLNKERNDKVYQKIRGQYSALKGTRRKLEQEEKANDPEIEKKREVFKEWHAKMKETVAGLLAEAKALEDKIYEASQPVARKYEITPVK